MRAERSIRILQFTDTHLFASPEGRLLGVDTFASFTEVVELALGQRGVPDFILLTGDLSQDESRQSYLALGSVVGKAGAPVYSLPGNHDRTLLLREVLPGCGAHFSSELSFLRGKWHIVLLDTSVEGKVEGRLSQSELDRLDRALRSCPQYHALVCLHHNPVSMSCPWLDPIGLDNSQEFFAVIDRHKQVSGIVWGHVHQEFDEMRGDIRLLATPSTCVQFKPKEKKFGLDAKAPGYRWLELMPGGGIETGVSRLGSLPGGLDLAACGY